MQLTHVSWLKIIMLVETMAGIEPVTLDNLVHDPTVWLRNLNDEDPVVFPCWPDNWPEKLAVCIEATSDKSLKISYAKNREAMLAYKNPFRLWFCNIPCGEFMNHVLYV